MKINCIHCGHSFELSEAYADYEGLIRCPTCGGLLDVRIESGMIRAVRPGNFDQTNNAATPDQATYPQAA